jgi:uncharacterized RDD family membrane protein YckC
MIPKCVICDTPYPAEIKFCPKDGGAVIPEAYRNCKLTITPHRKMKDFHKANVGNRFMAYIIDATICTLLTLPTVFFYMMADVSNTSTPSTYLILAGLSYFIPLTYLFVKDGMGEGQSWGKKIMKLKVVHASDMSKCTVATSALRSLITSLLFVLPVVGWLVKPIMILATADGRRLADRAAGTVVVNE